MTSPSAPVTRLMVALPPVLGGHTSVSEALVCLARHGSAHSMVGSLRRPLGALTRETLSHAERFGLAGWPVRDLLVGELVRVRSHVSLARAVEVLRQGILPLVLVIDRRGIPLGCLKRSDLESAAASIYGAAGARLNLPAALPSGARRVLREIGRRAPEGAWLVGGVVRDLLLGHALRDLDVVVQGSLEPVVAALGGKLRSHERFGTATLTLADGHVDLAQARRETYRGPAALPDVEPAPLAEDLFRRDFTINTLALSLAPSRFGALVDLYGGLVDLKRRRLRVLHGLSFIDDPTRAFRAVRFAVRLDGTIEPRTRRLLAKAVKSSVFTRLSQARLLREMRLALSEPELGGVVAMLDRHGLLGVAGIDAVPHRAALKRLPAVLRWYSQLADAEPVQQWVVALGLLVPESGVAAFDRLRPERADRLAAEEIADRARALAVRLARLRRKSAIWRACHGLRATTWVAAAAMSGGAATRRAIELHVTELRRTRLAIDGDDVMRAGVRRGPAVAQALEAARAAMLDGHAPDAAMQLEAALRYVHPG